MHKTITALAFALTFSSASLNAINISFLTKNKKEVRAEIAKVSLVAGGVSFILGVCSVGEEKRAFFTALYALGSIAASIVIMDLWDENQS